jgi:glycosyltransferase involved in cell wall biosynthesis
LYQAAQLSTDDTLFVIVGGKPHYIEEFRETYPERQNFLMVGEKKYESELPLYLRAADLAILPNTATEEISRVATSPLKLFAYMASGTPIVASDIPSLREILTDELAFFVPADNPEALGASIRNALNDMMLNSQRAARAQALVFEKYTWNQRAAAIVSFLSDHA